MKKSSIRLGEWKALINLDMIRDWFSLGATILYSKIYEYYIYMEECFFYAKDTISPLTMSYKELSTSIWCSRWKIIRWTKELIDKKLIYVKPWYKNTYFLTNLNNYPWGWMF